MSTDGRAWAPRVVAVEAVPALEGLLAIWSPMTGILAVPDHGVAGADGPRGASGRAPVDHHFGMTHTDLGSKVRLP